MRIQTLPGKRNRSVKSGLSPYKSLRGFTKISPTDSKRIYDKYNAGARGQDLADEYGVAVQTIFTHINKQKKLDKSK